MANQAIALQARAPQTDFMGRAIQQNAQMMNMMSQQRAAERQAAQAAQEMEIARAEEARKAALQAPAMEKAGAEAMSARVKMVDEFLDLSIAGMSAARDANDAIKIGDFLKQSFNIPELQGVVDQTLSSLPTDPAQFESWRQQTLFQSMDAKDQLSQEFQRQTTGREERVIAAPKFAGAPGGGAATEVPGSRIEAAEGITYVRGPNGEVIPMPKTVPGTGGAPGGAPSGGGAVAQALQTNPGALKDGPFARSQPGYAGASSGFATFKTPEDGIRAQESLLRSAYVGKGFNTIDKIVNRYAPPGPENSAASVSNYKKYIAQRTGIDINTPITASQVPAVAAAMREFETGNKPSGAGVNIRMGEPVAGTGKGEKVAAEALTAMEGVTAKYDKTIALAERLLKNPALDGIIGNVQGNIPETVLSLSSQDAANALSDYNALLAVAGFQELQAMRDASPTGGALGQVSDSENRLLQQSAFASSRTQSEAKFRESIKTYLNLLRESKARVEKAYERTYGQRFAPQRAPAGGGGRETQRGSNIDNLLKKYGG
ncbi:hypothetical protein UFOVP406_8 [uncultured Caudovirales phage]|uniref:Uncharacterized protein n=1 Tax=uncultured Caudovirales phage TaxID=2100421 RepID=A0A6J5M8Z6_9CAUD|nr:hypothetical protein UFOVP406_8 [uncultured Caudovirales phage]